MPRIKLNTIKLENFKGLKAFEAEFSGGNAVILAENGAGKTTVLDAYLFLFFNKDSTGRSDFAVRPLDADNQPIKGLVTAVEAAITVGGVEHVLRREQQENIVKGLLRGYTTVCTIDEVPKKVGEFQEWITNCVPEDIFKMLTDLSHFNSKMHWSDRRKVLLDIAGQIPTPAGFDGLTESHKGRTIDEYSKVLADRRKAYKKERDGINPRIDELQLGLKAYAQTHGDNEDELRSKRVVLIDKIAGLSAKVKALLATEKDRQEKYTKINQITNLRLHREGVVKNQSGPLEELHDERAKLEQDHADKTQELVSLQSSIQRIQYSIDSASNQIGAAQLTLAGIKEEYQKAKAKPADDKCYACGRQLPADQIADAESKRKAAITDIKGRGDKVKAQIDDTAAKKAALQDELNKLIAKEKAMVEELKIAEAAKNKRIEEIAETIKNRPQTDPSTDTEWQELTKQIEAIQAELGEPVSEQLEAIEAEKGTADELLRQMNESLAQADSIAKSKARIVELEAREKELAQLIADAEKELAEIDRYKVEQSKMIEASVNGRFDHVEWKLFKYNLNGSMEDTCEALLNGVPFPDMSAGQQIYCAIDCINTLSDHYVVEVPIFVDHAESMTLPIEAESQVIELMAVKGVTELEVKVEAGKAVV